MKTLTKVLPFVMSLCLVLSTVSLRAQDKKTGAVDEAPIIVKKVGGNEEYSSTLDLNDNRMQLLMAGQNYRTNYAIYAAVEMDKSSLKSEYKTLKSIKFEIVNYKPTYFIGIDSIIADTNKKTEDFTLKIYTRAMSKERTYLLTENDLKDIRFEKGSYLHSERYLNPMFPKKDANGNVQFDTDGRIVCEPDNGKAFDFEFFYKDGRHVVRKADYDKEKENPQTYRNEEPLTLPGKRCWESYNKIMF